MALSPSEIIQRHKEPRNRGQLDIAIRHEDKVKFSVKKCLPENLPYAYYEHLRRVEAKLPKPKYDKYVSEITFPLPHVKVADVIYSGLGKIWDGDKHTIDPQFTNPDLRADFLEYLEYHRIINKFKTDIWEAYKSQHNSILVIDMPQQMNGRYAEPYINIIDICSVVDIDVDKNGNIIHMVYKNENKDLVGIDEQNFYVIPHVNGDYLEGATLINWHGLKYCPAVFLVQDVIDSNWRIVKESPVTKCLFDFEKLMFRMIAGENLEDYVGYPVHIMRENECDYKNEQGNTCDGGRTLYITADNAETYIPCPNCAERHLSGPGSAFGAMPNPVTGEYDLDSVLKIVSADTDTLEYKDSSIEGRQQTIVMSCLGASQESMNGQAKNDKQMTSIYESQQSRLMNTKRNIEYAMKFCIEAMAQLRYEQAFKGCVVNLGTNFFLITVDQLQERLAAAIETGAPQYEIALIRGNINETEWRANPRMLQRLKILERLEPYANFSITDMNSLLSQNKISQEYFDLKYNFALFVSRFEDENGDIVDFGEVLQPAKKIEIIFNRLLEYAKQSTNQSKPAESNAEGLRQQGQ